MEDFAEASFEDPAGNAAVVCDLVDPEAGTAEIGADELAGMVNGECCFFRVHEKGGARVVDYVKYVRQLSQKTAFIDFGMSACCDPICNFGRSVDWEKGHFLRFI